MPNSARTSLRSITIVSLALCYCLANAGPPDWFQWLDREVLKKIKLNGYRILGLHSYSVSGDAEAFNNLTYYGQGEKTFTDFGQLRVQGQNVVGILNFQAQILDSRFQDPQGQRFSLDYVRKGWTVNAGDILGSINFNRFAYFNKSLRGISVGYTKGRFSGKILQSQARGSAKTVTIQGNNSPGPYYLQSNQVVRGSEQVQVDGQDMQPVRDYVMNYELGAITFVNRIISPSSSVVVTYEAFGFNTAQGIVHGIGLSYDLGRIGKVGVTGLQQIARGGGASSSVLETFQGYGPPSTPYILQFEPAPGREVVVKVDGVQQVLGRDYYFDADSPSIFYITRFVPASSNVDVIYTPKPRGTADGDRESLGFEYKLPLGTKGKNGELAYSQAVGRLKSDITPLSGTARGLNLRYNTGKLEFVGSLRDVPADYVTVETRGFNRNDKSMDWNLTYKQSKDLTLGVGANNSAIANRTTSSAGEPIVNTSRFTVAKAYAAYRPDKGTTWSAEQRRTQSRYSGQDTKLDLTSLNYNRRFGRVDTRLGFERQDGTGPVRAGTNSSTGHLHIDTLRLGASYALDEKLTLAGTSSYSGVSAGGEHGKGLDYSLLATYQPSTNLRVSSEYSLSDSGALATLGRFQNGYGLGYDGNGFSGGINSDFTLGSTSYRMFKVTTEYDPNEKISLNADFTNARTVGSVSSNSETTAIGLGATMDLGRGLQISTTLDQSSTRFVDSEASSRATNLNFALNGSPPGRLSYRVGLSLLLTGGQSDFKQNSTSYEAALVYTLAKRHNLTLNFFTGSTSGYYPQDNLNASLIYQYQIWQNLALNIGYKYADVHNRDPKLTSGAYRASGFDLELSFNFGGF